VAGMLAAQGIEGHVGGQYLQGGVGELAPMDFATVLVADEDYESALPVIAAYDQSAGGADSGAGSSRHSGLFSRTVLFWGVTLLLLYWFLF